MAFELHVICLASLECEFHLGKVDNYTIVLEKRDPRLLSNYGYFKSVKWPKMAKRRLGGPQRQLGGPLTLRGSWDALGQWG